MGAERLYVVVPANHRFGAKRRKDLSAFAEVQWHSFPTNRSALEFCGSLLESQLAAGGVVYPQITTVGKPDGAETPRRGGVRHGLDAAPQRLR